MTTERLQCWTLFMLGFDNTFQHMKGDFNKLSSLPLKVSEDLLKDNFEYVNMIEKSLSVKWKIVWTETQWDCVF